MKTKEHKKLLSRIAEQNGVTPKEVERDMQIAIDEGLNSHDPNVQNTWILMSSSGQKPSAKDVIEYAVCRLQSKNNAI